MRKLGWNVLFVLLAVGTGIYLSLKPWEVYRDQRAKADQAVLEMNEAERSRAKLMEDKANYESPLGREQLARQKNYIKPGEKPVETRL